MATRPTPSFEQHRPDLHHENKRVVFGIACPEGPVAGRSRAVLGRVPLPDRTDPTAALVLLSIRDGFYDYTPLHRPGSRTRWP